MTESMAELRGVLSAKTLSRLGSREKAHAGSWATQCVRYSVLHPRERAAQQPRIFFSFLFFFCSLRCHLTLPVGRGFKCCLEFWLVTWDC